MPFMTTPERIGREEGLPQGLVQGIEVALELEFGEAGLRLMRNPEHPGRRETRGTSSHLNQPHLQEKVK